MPDINKYMTKPLNIEVISRVDHKITSRTESMIHPVLAEVTEVIGRCQVGFNKLKRYTPIDTLPYDTTQVTNLDIGFGQPRAIKALNTALAIKANGYHVFAAGENGLGKRTTISRLLQDIACKASTPNDWVYVHNFDDPRTPLSLSLPAGCAKELQQQVHKLWRQVKNNLTQSFITLKQLEDKKCTDVATAYRNTTERTLNPLFKKIYVAFANHQTVITYLQAMYSDMVTHASSIVSSNDCAFKTTALMIVPSRYTINIMVSHEPGSGAPVVFEDLPTYLNLSGRVEHMTQSGSLLTDVSMIRAGALHRANGGYLLLEASHLLAHPNAWQALKRALQSRMIQPSSFEQMPAFTGNLSLTPTPIDLDIKVILLGEADLYYELLNLEPEFDAVFKVRADFHDDVTRTTEHELALVAKMADIITHAHLFPFDNSAQATLLEHLSLQAEDQNRLSLHSDRLIKLLHESNRHADLQGKTIVNADHVAQAIHDMDERSGYLRDLYWDELKNGQQLIVTKGEAIGQVNALTVVSYADSEFGMPARLTALIQPNIGAGDILDIERDVDLGGSLHAKGMLIMTSYLRALFSQHHALNFSASLAFEQSYAQIDGDSATVGEACALLSALAGVPIRQSLAITGSMNQLGEIQAVGGINSKIAGFFDACCEQGLTGEQGVVIPMANLTQLMLRDDIIAAVKSDRFYVYGVRTINEALTLMTGMPTDTMNQKGRYHKKTLFGKILRRLILWSESQGNESQADDLLEDKKSKKKAKRKRKAKRQRKEDNYLDTLEDDDCSVDDSSIGSDSNRHNDKICRN